MNLINVENAPFEAQYEAAKQSVIAFLGEVARVYELPTTLINILVYEIALEARNATFSAIIGNCEVSYPNTNETSKPPTVLTDEPKETEPEQEPIVVDTSSPKGKSKMMKTEDALKEFEKMGIKVNRIDLKDDANLENESA